MNDTTLGEKKTEEIRIMLPMELYEFSACTCSFVQCDCPIRVEPATGYEASIVDESNPSKKKKEKFYKKFEKKKNYYKEHY